MDKAERKTLSAERDAVMAQLASIREVETGGATPGVHADVSEGPALRARLDEINRLLR